MFIAEVLMVSSFRIDECDLLKENFDVIREIRIPTVMSSELAELVGIHFGDGGIQVRIRKSYQINYCVGVKEVDLIDDILRLFKLLFDVDIKHFNVGNAVQFYCCSKEIAYFLHDNFCAPFGKKNNLLVPVLIKRDDIYLIAFLRGLYRTDGCYFLKRFGKYEYPIVKITMKSPSFAEEIRDALLRLGFRARINKKSVLNCYGYDVVLHGKKQCEMWGEIILKNSGAAGI